MRTLFPSNINWSIFLFVAIFLRVLLPGLSMLSYIALVLALHQFTLLFVSIGYIIPIRYLFGAFMSLQFFIGPILAYNGFDQYQYHAYMMQISEIDYFSYAIPAVFSFIIGLHFTAGNFKGEILDKEGIKVFVNRNPKLPYVFIGLGLFASVLSTFFSSEITFVFYLLGNFKFVGLFMIAFSGKQLKAAPLILVISSIIASSLGTGMFHDLLTWILFVGSVYAIRYEFGIKVKIIACIGFILLSVIIQQLKGGYRIATKSEGEEAGLETLSDIYESQNTNDHSIFSFSSLAPSVTRINQGFIITHIMSTVPDVVPYSHGEEMGEIIKAAVLPRIIAPDKLQAGDRTIFEKYTRMHLRLGTSMGLSSVGDAYLNFGILGGCFCMFLLGYLYSSGLNYFEEKSSQQPVILFFLPLIYYYPIRPDCELQTILGHFVKATFLIFLIFYFWKNFFRSSFVEQ